MEPRSLLVTRHDPSTIQKIGIDSKNALERAVEYFVKKFGGEKNHVDLGKTKNSKKNKKTK